MSSKLPLPFVSYRHVVQERESYSGQMPSEHEYRMRHWCLARFQHADDEPGQYRTVAGMFITMPSPDFCGGLYVYAPRVEVYHRNAGWYGNRVSPANNDKVSWEDIDRGEYALDLSEIQPTWTRDEAIDYMRMSMACAVISVAAGRSKRCLQAADRDGGQLSELFECLQEVATSEFIPFHREYWAVGEVPKNAAPGLHYATGTGTFESADWHVNTFNHNGIYNINSGNHVVLWNAVLHDPTWDYDEDGEREDLFDTECPECGYYTPVGEGTTCMECGHEDAAVFDPRTCNGNRAKIDVPSSWSETLKGKAYWSGVAPHFWGNG